MVFCTANPLKRFKTNICDCTIYFYFYKGFSFFCHWLAGYFCRLLRENERTGRWMNTWYWYPLLKCQRAVRFALHGEATAGSSDQGSAACNQCSENHNQTTTCLTTHSGPVIACVVIVCFIQLPVLNRVHRGSCWPRIKKTNVRQEFVIEICSAAADSNTHDMQTALVFHWSQTVQ